MVRKNIKHKNSLPINAEAKILFLLHLLQKIWLQELLLFAWFTIHLRLPEKRVSLQEH